MKIENSFLANNIQKRMYLNSLNNNKISNNLCLFGEIPIDVNLLDLKYFLEEKLEKISEINISFFDKNGKIYYKILDEKVEVIFLEVDEFIPTSLIRCFDMTNRLYRVKIIKTKLKNYLFLEFHHILLDEEGINNLIKFLNNNLNYEENRVFNIDYKQENLNNIYHLNIKLINNSAKLPIQVEKKAEKCNSSIKYINLEDNLIDTLKRANSLGYSDSIILNFSLAKLISLYAKNNTISYGIVFNTRSFKEIDSIGMFANIIPLVYKFEETNIKDEIDKYENSYYNLFELCNYDFSDFNSENIYNKIRTLYVTQYEYNKSIEKFKINLIDIDIPENDFDFIVECKNKALRITYNTEIFNDIQINLIIENYKKIILNTTQQLINESSNINISIPQSFMSGEKYLNDNIDFEKFMFIHDSKIIIEDKNEKFSKKDIYLLMNSIINNPNINTEDKVAIYLDRTGKLPLITLVCFLLNMEFVIIDKKLPEIRKKYILNNSKIKQIIYDDIDFVIDNIKLINITHIFKDEFISNIKKIENNTNYKNNGFICYTSGTTGEPKSVMIKRDSIINMVINSNKFLEFDENTRGISIANTTFDMYYAEILLTILNGGYIYILDENEQSNTKEFEIILNRKNISTMFITPSRFNVFIRLKLLFIFDKMKSICFGGEDIKFDVSLVKNKLKNVKLFNLYGPTETTFYVMQKEIYDNYISLGTPVINTDIMLLDANNNIVNIYEEGEVTVLGENVCDGYYNYDSNNFIEIEGRLAYKTGDFAKIDNFGNLIYLGRKDKQIKIRGQRLDISELEKVLKQNINIKEYLIDIKDNEIYLGVKIVNNYSFNMLRNYILEQLPSYFCPKYIIDINNVITNINGKAIFNIEDEEDKENHKENNHYINLKSLQIVKSVICETLNIDKINNTTSIISLGADSLKVLEISALLQQKGIEVTAFEILKNQTPIKIVECIDKEIPVYISNNNIIDSIPIYNFYLLRNKISDKFNISFNLKVCQKFNLNDIIQILEKWISLSSLFDYSFVIKNNNIEIQYKNVKNNIEIKVFEDSINIKEIKNIQNNQISLKNNNIISITVFKFNNSWYIGFAIHHFIIDVLGIQYIIEELTNIINKNNIKLRNAFIDNQIELKRRYDENKELVEKIYNDLMENKNNLNIEDDNYNIENKIVFSKKKFFEVSDKLNIKPNILLLSLIIFSFKVNNEKTINIMIEKQGHEDTNSFGWCTKIGVINQKLNKNITLVNVIKNIIEQYKILETEGYNYLYWLNNEMPKTKNIDVLISYNYLMDLFIKNDYFEIENFGGKEVFSENISFGTKIDINVLNEVDLDISFNFKNVNKNFVDSFIKNLENAYQYLLKEYNNKFFKLDIFSENCIFKDDFIQKNKYKLVMPLTYMQKNILKNCIINNNTDSAKICMTYKVHENLDIEKLKKSIEIYVNENNYLSSKLSKSNDEYYFYIDEHNKYYFKIIEINNEKQLTSSQQINMDIYNDFYIKFIVYKLNNNLYISIIANHILLDGMSIGYIISDILKLYEDKKNLVNRTNNMLKYSYWINSQNQFKNIFNFHKKIENINFENYNICKKFNELSEDLNFIHIKEKIDNLYNIDKYCLMNNFTISNFMHSVYCLTKQLTNNINNTFFNSIDFGRSIHKFNLSESVGMFINRRLYLSYDVKNDIKINAWIKNFIDYNLFLPEELIFDVNKLRLTRKLDLFGYENFSQDKLLSPNREIMLELISGYENFDIDFNFRVINNEYIFIDYNSNSIDEDYVTLFLSNYKLILKLVLENSNTTLFSIKNKVKTYLNNNNLDNNNLDGEIKFNNLEKFDFLNIIWRKILNSDQSNFVLAGGDSLKAMELINTINDFYSTSISTHHFLKNPNKMFLYELLENKKSEICLNSEYTISYSQKKILTDILLNENHYKNLLSFKFNFTNENIDEVINHIIKVLDNNAGIFINLKYKDGEILQYLNKGDLSKVIKIIKDDNFDDIYYINKSSLEIELFESLLFRCFINVNSNQILFVISHIICDGKSLDIIKNDFKLVFSGKELVKHNDILLYLENRSEVNKGYNYYEINSKYSTDNDYTAPNLINKNTSKCIIFNLEDDIIKMFSNVSSYKINYNTIFLTAFSRMLKNMNIDIFNIILDGRTLNNSSDVFGMLTNIVPFKTYYKEKIDEIQQILLECIYFQYYDFENINLSQNGIFYIYQPTDIKIESIDNNFISQVPFGFEVINNKYLRIAYSENYYSTQEIKNMLKLYKCHLKNILIQLLGGL